MFFNQKKPTIAKFEFVNSESTISDSAEFFIGNIPIPKHLEISSSEHIAHLDSGVTKGRIFKYKPLIDLTICFLKRCELHEIDDSIIEADLDYSPEYECLSVDNLAPDDCGDLIITQGIKIRYDVESGIDLLHYYRYDLPTDFIVRYINAYSLVRGKLFKFSLSVLPAATQKEFPGLTSVSWLKNYVRQFIGVN